MIYVPAILRACGFVELITEENFPLTFARVIPQICSWTRGETERKNKIKFKDPAIPEYACSGATMCTIWKYLYRLHVCTFESTNL